MTDYPEDNPDVVSAFAPADGTVGAHPEPALVYEAETSEAAEVVRATLEAAGIPAFLKHQTDNPLVGSIDEAVGDAWRNGVFVAPANVEAARAVLDAPSLSEEELSAEVDADPTTLAEAEARTKNA